MNGPTFAPASTSTTSPRPVMLRNATPARPPAPPTTDNVALRVLGYVRLHWLTILFAGALLGAALGYAAWVFLPAKSESYALFRVTQNPDSVGGMGDPNRGRSEFNTFVKTSALLVKTDNVYRSALRNEKFRISELPTLKKERDPIKWLNENVMVTSTDGAEIITMSLKGDNAEDVRIIMDAMVKAYDDEVINKERNEWTERKKLLVLAKSKLEVDLKLILPKGTEQGTVLAEKSPLRNLPPENMPNAMPNVMPGGNVVQAAATEAVVEKDEIRRQKGQSLASLTFSIETVTMPEFERRVAVAKAEIEGIKQDMVKVLEEPAPEELRQAIETNDVDYKKAKAKAKALASDYEQKSATVKNPGALVGMQAEIENAEVEARRIIDDKAEQAMKQNRKLRTDAMTRDIEKFQRTIALLETDRGMVRKRLEGYKAELRNMPPSATEQQKIEKQAAEKLITAESLNGTKTGEIYQQVVSQLTVADLNAANPTRISIYQPASTPMQKEPLKQYIMAAVAGMMGFVLVAAGLVGYEMTQRKASSLSEVRASTLVPVVGVVPWLPDDATARDPIKRADVSEAIDKLRSYVAQSWLARGATTITVTSALGDEGKAFIAFGLASSLAQSGYKTLLVDFDLRNPSLHPYAGLANNVGVCELLRGETDFRNTIQVLPNSLHFLPAGKWSDEARLAAVGDRLESLLARLKEPFDCVVLHGHALLTVAESVEVARRSEVVILCAQYRETQMPMLKKATDRVSSMEVPYSGVVYVGATPKEALC